MGVIINTPFPIMFTLFFILTFDLQLFAFFMSTLINNIKTAYASVFCFLVVATVINAIFSVPFIYQIIYADYAGWSIQVFKAFLFVFCPYSFSKAYIEIATIASTKLNEVTFMNIVGRKYEYSDLFKLYKQDLGYLGYLGVIDAYPKCFLESIFNHKEKYVNGGVLLINVKKWKEITTCRNL